MAVLKTRDYYGFLLPTNQGNHRAANTCLSWLPITCQPGELPCCKHMIIMASYYLSTRGITVLQTRDYNCDNSCDNYHCFLLTANQGNHRALLLTAG